MTVSVIIPVHNKAPYLLECLKSVLEQTYPVLELIAVDDASTDESPEILTSCTDPRVRVVRLSSNVGPGMAAQHAMDLAQGELVVRMDADDVMNPDRVAQQVAFLREHPEVDIVGTALSVLGHNDIVRRCPAEHDAIVAQLVFGVGLYQPTMAVRRASFVRSGLRYKTEWPFYGEDRLYQLEAVLLGLRLANLEGVGVRYREGEQNTVHGRDRWADHRALHTRVLSALGHPTPTDAQLLVHAYGSRYFPGPVGPKSVRAFRQWLDHLDRWAARAGTLPLAPFRERLDRAWEEVYHPFADRGPSLVWAYWRSGGRMTWARMRYALGVWMERTPKQAVR
jgi:glycosyltransferase involved in cell wall biosynthesis